MCDSCSDRVVPFSSASGSALSQEAADSKINVQSACSLNTAYKLYALPTHVMGTYNTKAKPVSLNRIILNNVVVQQILRIYYILVIKQN
jgi:hypothetical protein